MSEQPQNAAIDLLLLRCADAIAKAASMLSYEDPRCRVLISARHQIEAAISDQILFEGRKYEEPREASP